MTHMMEQMTIPGLEETAHFDSLRQAQGNAQGASVAGRPRWPVVKLGDILEKIEAGVSPQALNRPAEPHELGVLKVSAVTWNKFRADENKALHHDFDATGYHRVKKGDLLLSRANTSDLLASPVVVEKDYPNLLLSDKTLRLTPKSNLTSEKFLYYLLKTKAARVFFKSHSTGTSGSMSNVSQATIRLFEIPLPTLPEQQHIVARLDQAQRLIDQRKEQLKLMDALVQSLFYEMFGDPVKNEKGWDVKPLGDLLYNIDSGTSPICLAFPSSTDKWGVLKLSAVTGGFFLPNSNKQLPEDEIPKVEDEVHFGDLLFSRKNTKELVGSCAYVFQTRAKLLLPDLIFRFVTKPNVEKLFLWGLFNNSEFKGIIQSLAGGSAASMINISKAKLYSLEVPLPPLPLQQTFADRVQQIEALKQQMQAILAELEQSFQALMQEAFGT